MVMNQGIIKGVSGKYYVFLISEIYKLIIDIIDF